MKKKLQKVTNIFIRELWYGKLDNFALYRLIKCKENWEARGKKKLWKMKLKRYKIDSSERLVRIHDHEYLKGKSLYEKIAQIYLQIIDKFKWIWGYKEWNDNQRFNNLDFKILQKTWLN